MGVGIGCEQEGYATFHSISDARKDAHSIGVNILRIKSIRIKNFRTIKELTFEFGQLTAIYGPNSCGKSNLLAAIQYAFRDDLSKKVIRDNLPREMLVGQGGPKLSTWIWITFENVPANFCRTVGITTANEIEFEFRAIKSGTVSRRIGGIDISPSNFLSHFSIVFVPAIRDILTSGLEPFMNVYISALKKKRGEGGIKQITETVRSALADPANTVLSGQSEILKQMLNDDGLGLNTKEVVLDDLYSLLSLTIKRDGKSIPLEQMGTGHQSAVVMGLYRSFGEATPGKTLYLFEEPANHLHPTSTRSIGDELKKISEDSQVILSSHSPILLEHFGLENAIGLKTNDSHETQRRNINLTNFTDKQIRSVLQVHSLRSTEPLFAKRVVLVEGVSDINALSCIYEHRNDSFGPNYNDILVVATNGKGRIVELAELLTSLDVEWRALLDWDAVESGDFPVLVPLDAGDLATATQACDDLLAWTETSNKRGDGVRKNLEHIRKQLVDGLPSPVAFTGSCLEKILNIASASGADKTSIRNAIAGRQKTVYRGLLKKYGICIWPVDLEDSLVQKNGSESYVEQSLIRLNLITANMFPNPGKKAKLVKYLSKRKTEVEMNREVVSDLEANRQFSKTDINYNFNVLFG